MVHIIQNDPEVPAGLVGEELRRRGVERTVVRLYDGERLPEPTAVSAVIVLGGAMGANDEARYPFLADLKAFVARLVRQEVPYLGICLGGQLLSAATGGVVTSGSNGEKGTYSIVLTDEGGEDRLLRGLGEAFVSFQWHDDSFSIPPGGTRLAFTGSCRNQAFRVGKCAWGVQFHPEVTDGIVREWSSWTPETAARTGEFVASFRQWDGEYRQVAARMVENFLEIAGLTAATGT